MNRETVAKVLFALIALTVIAQPVVAATAMTGADAINETADAAHDPFVDGDMTKSTHEMGWSVMEYENNNGNVVTHDGQVNSSVDNPYQLIYSDVETSAYGEFPVNTGTEDAKSALDATNWTTDATGTAGTVSVADATTAPGVEAVQVSTASQTGTDTAKATFDEFKVTSDAEKRVVQLVVDVNTLDAGAAAFIRFKDTDGDYVEAEIDTSVDASVGNNLSNSTGEGYVFQRKVGSMAVAGPGAGTMGNINATTVVVNDANADISIAALNVERTSPWTLGNERVDTDGDGTLETRTIQQVNETGGVALHSLGSMGPVFNAATIHDLTIPFKEHSSANAPVSVTERYNVTYTEATDYPSFDWLVNDYRRFTVETAYDLSYANLELRDDVAVPGNRYNVVEYATGIGTTNFSKVTWTDVSSSYNNKGDEVTLATGISAGNALAVHYDDYRVTQPEYDNLTKSGGGGAPMDDSGGGGLGSIPIIGGALIALLSFLGLRDSGSGGA